MVVKNNPIAYLENHGYRWTSDPNLYFKSYNPNRGKKPWGKRDHYEYGINVDSYCGGYHRAYDMVKWHGAGIPAIANATVLRGTGWNTFGWTLVLGFKDKKGRSFQVIYGHLNRNPLLDVRIGQNVKQGQIVAYQGASNNLNVTMNSHLHIQFQNYQSYNEWQFTCLGIDPLNIDVSKSSPTSGSTPTKVKKPSTTSKKTVNRNKNGWKWSGTFQANTTIVVRSGKPGLASPTVGTASHIKKGQWVNFDHLWYKDGYWWIRFKYAAKGASTAYFFMPVGRKQTGVTFRQANNKKQLWGTVTKLNSNEKTSGVKNWKVKGSVKTK